MPINKTLLEEIKNNFKEENQSEELIKLCIELLTIEHDNPELIKSKSERTIYWFKEDYNYSKLENDFLYYEDKKGGIKLPNPNVNGQFQLENISTAIATLRSIDQIKIKEEHIKSGITKIHSIARLQEIKKGKLKDLVKNNRLFIDGSHNPLGAKVLNEFLETLDCDKHIILGMMANKNHQEYVIKNLLRYVERKRLSHLPNALLQPPIACVQLFSTADHLLTRHWHS